jgi:K+-transporting ATPase c subunit
MEVSTVRTLIRKYTEDRQWSFLGEPVVNVTALNRALRDLPVESKKSR